MKQFLQDLAASNGWGFLYARTDFQNLYDGLDNNTPLLFLDPLQFTEEVNDYGSTESLRWSGKMLLCMPSNFDEIGYDERYERYIRPITLNSFKTFKNSLRCSPDLTLISLSAVEVINSFDFNCDGLAITFEIREYINE